MPKFTSAWLRDPQFKDWLEKSSSNRKKGIEYAFCKVCKLDITAHKSVIKRHSNSEKHKFNLKQVNSNVKLPDLYKTTPLEENVRIAEIKFCGLLTTNNLPFSLMDTLAPLLSSVFPDSQIAKRMSTRRTKATAIVNESLGKIFLTDLYDILKKPGAFFSLIVDETTDISVTKQCAFTVIHFVPETNSVATRFFDVIEAKGCSADDLYEALISSIESKAIPLANFIGFASDTPNVMTGIHHSVFSLLKQAIPGILCVKCSCHLIHLAASKACLLLPRSVEDLLRNIGSHFSRSSARQQKFKEFQEFFQVKIHKILSPAVTRWLSLKQCVDRVLEQFEPLKAYLRVTVFEDPSVTTEQMITTMDNQFTLIYLEFMSYVLGLLTEFNLLFQSEKPLLYKVKPETDRLLKILCSNYLQLSYIKGHDIFSLNHRDQLHFVQQNHIYLGVQATQSLHSLKDAGDEAVKKFYESISRFYVELVDQIKERFRFEDPIYNILKIVDPSVVQNYEIKSLEQVTTRFPALKDVITNVQTLDNEWKDLALVDFTNINTTEADQFWKQIFNLKSAAGMERFPNVKQVISLLLVLPFSNASVERVFSDLFNIKTDKRNLLSTNTLRSILASKDGIQNKGGIVEFKPSKEMVYAKIWQ